MTGISEVAEAICKARMRHGPCQGTGTMPCARCAAYAEAALAAQPGQAWQPIETALRQAFPHFQDGAPITPKAIADIGREYIEMVMGWMPALIGPLLDAWDLASNDVKSALREEEPALCEYLDKIARAIEE